MTLKPQNKAEVVMCVAHVGVCVCVCVCYCSLILMRKYCQQNQQLAAWTLHGKHLKGVCLR